MKKVFYALTIGLLTTASAFAQSQLLPKVNGGIKGGANLSNFSATTGMSTEAKVGFQAGLWSRIAIGAVHLQPELYYVQKEAKLTQSAGNWVNNVTFKSIDLPILIGYAWGGDEATGRINTGPLVSFGVGNKQTAGSELNGSGVRIGDQNYSWVVGAGVDVSRLSIDLRYEYGLNQKLTYSNVSKVRVSLFSLSLAYPLFAL